MKFVSAISLDRKSGVALGGDVLFSFVGFSHFLSIIDPGRPADGSWDKVVSQE